MTPPILRRVCVCLLAVALTGCGAGAARKSVSVAAGHPAGAGSGTTGSDPKPARPATPGGASGATGPSGPSGRASLTNAPRVSGGAEASGKVGSTPDPLPAASGAAHVAPGAPSDAQVRSQLQQELKAGVVAPSASSAQALAQGATYVGTPSGSWAFPIQPLSVAFGPSTWSLDQGVDVATTGAACGASAVLVAITDGTVVQEGISGFGPAAPVVRLDQGPWRGWYVYYGHAFPDYVHIGDHVRAGQPIASVGCGIVGLSSGPHLEIGLSPPGSAYCCPGVGQTAAAVNALMQQLYARSRG